MSALTNTALGMVVGHLVHSHSVDAGYTPVVDSLFNNTSRAYELMCYVTVVNTMATLGVNPTKDAIIRTITAAAPVIAGTILLDAYLNPCASLPKLALDFTAYALSLECTRRLITKFDKSPVSALKSGCALLSTAVVARVTRNATSIAFKGAMAGLTYSLSKKFSS